MAENNLPPSADDTEPRAQVVLPDPGGWISGPCISFDAVPADEVSPADLLVLDDGIVVTVLTVIQGVFNMPESREHGVEIIWEQHEGPATGKLIRPADTLVHRVRNGVRPVRPSGPFETADEARELPEVRAIYESFAKATPGSVLLADGASELLRQALDDAGVSLGAYDRALTAWMGGFEPQIPTVIASWVTRARAVEAGRVTLDSDQAATVVGALTVAAETVGDWVASCRDCTEGRCATCNGRLRAAEAYEAVAEHIRAGA